MALSFMLGIVLTFAALNRWLLRHNYPAASDVALVRQRYYSAGLFLQMILAPTIALISYGIYKLKSR